MNSDNSYNEYKVKKCENIRMKGKQGKSDVAKFV